MLSVIDGIGRSDLDGYLAEYGQGSRGPIGDDFSVQSICTNVCDVYATCVRRVYSPTENER